MHRADSPAPVRHGKLTFGDAEPIPEDQLKEQPAQPEEKGKPPVKK
jgi:hypothetical protein